jgi:methionyl-tRNA formyltransferase
MSSTRVAVIVTPDASDLYFANQLIRRVNVVGVIVETQLAKPDNTPALAKALKLWRQPRVLLGKASARIAAEARRRFAIYNQPENEPDFGEDGRRLCSVDTCATLYTPGVRDINAPENVAWLRGLNPDVVAVCGASILRDAILSVPSKGILNLHGGLAQEYRGLFTTEWAIYNEQPEYIGATVHFVSAGIDDGDIVYQGRPNMGLEDNPHTLYVKVVRLGVDMMEQAIRDVEHGTLLRTALPEKGKVYLRRMFTPDKQDATWRKLRKGVISSYLENRAARDAPVLRRMVNNYCALGHNS